MKNINNKTLTLIQKLKIEIYFSENHLSYAFEKQNFIGFVQEQYNPEHKDFINNFNQYNHFVFYSNKKLDKKYPVGVYKKDYKQWMKRYEL